MFIHQTSLIRTFNTYLSTTQYPFGILYLPKQIQMNIVYWKPGLKREFSSLLIYKNLFRIIINKYLKAKNSLHTTRISNFRYVFIGHSTLKIRFYVTQSCSNSILKKSHCWLTLPQYSSSSLLSILPTTQKVFKQYDGCTI